MIKNIAGFVLGVALAILGSLAHAADTATISFTAPTQYTDGTAIPAGTAINYNVYQGLQNGLKGKVATITATSTTISAGMVAGNTYCWEVTSVIAGAESPRSNEACKFIKGTAAQPVVITVTKNMGQFIMEILKS